MQAGTLGVCAAYRIVAGRRRVHVLLCPYRYLVCSDSGACGMTSVSHDSCAALCNLGGLQYGMDPTESAAYKF